MTLIRTSLVDADDLAVALVVVAVAAAVDRTW